MDNTPSKNNLPTPLIFRIDATSSLIRGRASTTYLPHGAVPMPIYMPVGTQATVKGLTTSQIESVNPPIILNNTYFVAERPGPRALRLHDRGAAPGEGTHALMDWPRNILTDSGGFQMVSLLNLSSVSEAGVKFLSPVDASQRLLRPEDSVAEQFAIGSDCLMVLDDVVASTLSFEECCGRIREATERTVRWLDRCLAQAQMNPNRGRQAVYAILQGHLNKELREYCIHEFAERADYFDGIAIGGLSGGESKRDFWQTVALSCQHLDQVMPNKPRYLMGVGMPIDIVVAVCLGVDQMDCVYATRTGRFGTALTAHGQLRLRHAEFRTDVRPIDDTCTCECCRTMSRAALRAQLMGDVSNAGILISIHNVTFLLGLVKGLRAAILAGEEVTRAWLTQFFTRQCPEGAPQWARDALRSMGCDLWGGQNSDVYE